MCIESVWRSSETRAICDKVEVGGGLDVAGLVGLGVAVADLAVLGLRAVNLGQEDLRLAGALRVPQAIR